MRNSLYKSASIAALAVVAILPFACRTAEYAVPAPQAALNLTAVDTSKQPILKKSLGALTQKYPENRIEDCIILESDVSNLTELQKAIAAVKGQALQEGFIFRAQIPSIQYFAYSGTEAVLLSELSDEKTRYRRPEGEQGNPSLDTLMAVIDAKCGAKDATP